ncbi:MULTISPECIES: TniB family NTP-binding protein [unclassified Colwellia]|uniref:TniB family NTP-binding protein n=1 Tax=unclassified Colwellia TaxID=196834 RepID=UPI0015F52681|nr:MULTISPECIES: TniB family NTP-binding protein [unclassified Colwellia]MBA6254721.1 TniB family NTP-binding protein [Colwellia sp. MB3u-28]MBA6259231.1 TniB family NTP-binding protein [Colwellia sp. MB3u-41]
MGNSNREHFITASKLPQRQFIEMAHCKDILNELDYVHGRAVAGEPCGLVISGPTGSGKSSILKYYKTTWDDELPAGEPSPIVYIRTPSKPSEILMLESELKALGDPAPRKGTSNSKRERKEALIKNLHPKVFIYDDFQHVIEYRGTVVARQLLDELKNISEEYGVSLVFTGINTVEIGGLINEQINSRFSSLRRLKVMSTENDDEFNYFQEFLEDFSMTKGITNFDMASEDSVYRFAYACGGDLRILNHITNKALHYFNLSKDKEISLEHFVPAFDDVVSEEWDDIKVNKVNPFDTDNWATIKRRMGIK